MFDFRRPKSARMTPGDRGREPLSFGLGRLREKIVEAKRERVAPSQRTIATEARNLRHAAHANAVAEPRNCDLVGFIEECGARSTPGVGHGDGDRIPFDGIHRNAHA